MRDDNNYWYEYYQVIGPGCIVEKKHKKKDIPHDIPMKTFKNWYFQGVAELEERVAWKHKLLFKLFRGENVDVPIRYRNSEDKFSEPYGIMMNQYLFKEEWIVDEDLSFVHIFHKYDRLIDGMMVEEFYHRYVIQSYKFDTWYLQVNKDKHNQEPRIFKWVKEL